MVEFTAYNPRVSFSVKAGPETTSSNTYMILDFFVDTSKQSGPLRNDTLQITGHMPAKAPLTSCVFQKCRVVGIQAHATLPLKKNPSADYIVIYSTEAQLANQYTTEAHVD